MSAIRDSGSDRWLTVIAAAALVYAVALIVFSIGVDRTAAHWIGRIGSVSVIAGVLVHQRHIAIDRSATFALAISRAGIAMVVGGAIAIVMGLALGLVGF